jgi:hypothetical protein
MDWQRYKELCDAPWTFSRWMLEQTLELAQQQGAPLPDLEHTLDGEPLPKPPGHRGGSATDMFELTMALGRARDVYGLISRAVEAGHATRATARRGLGGFEAAWREYLLHLERN